MQVIGNLLNVQNSIRMQKSLIKLLQKYNGSVFLPHVVQENDIMGATVKQVTY